MQESLEELTQWVNQLKRFLYDEFLVESINDRKIRKEFVSQEAMNKWVVAFTDRSATGLQNSKVDEWIGDTVMANCLGRYLKQEVLKDRTEVTALHYFRDELLSTEWQGKTAKRLGLSKFLKGRNIDPNNMKLNENLLEATFGCLQDLGDEILGLGKGWVLCYRQLKWILKGYVFDLSKRLESSKTIVIKDFKALRLGRPIIDIIDQGLSGIKGTFRLTEQQHSILLNNDFKLPEVLAEASAPDMRRLEKELYGQAQKKMEQAGMTKEVMTQIDDDRYRQDPDLKPLIDDLEDVLDRAVSFIFPKSISSKGRIAAQVITINENHQAEIIGSGFGSDYPSALKTALESALESSQSE